MIQLISHIKSIDRGSEIIHNSIWKMSTKDFVSYPYPFLNFSTIFTNLLFFFFCKKTVSLNRILKEMTGLKKTVSLQYNLLNNIYGSKEMSKFSKEFPITSSEKLTDIEAKTEDDAYRHGLVTIFINIKNRILKLTKNIIFVADFIFEKHELTLK